MEMTKEAHDFINRGLMLFPDNLILKDELCYNLEIEGDIKERSEVCNELIDKNPYPTTTGSLWVASIPSAETMRKRSKHSTLPSHATIRTKS
ncbi:MAG: hypothetical protein ACLRS8_12480 [Parabacteroides merdae]